MMNRTLRVLNVEDSRVAAEFLQLNLSRAGFAPIFKRVETSEAMKAALETEPWDVILCDFSMPQFNAPEALALVKEMGLDIPFIIISGTVGEAMRAGAHDYFMKDNLVRLAPTIEREMAEAENRRARRQAEEWLKNSVRTWTNPGIVCGDGCKSLLLRCLYSQVWFSDGKAFSGSARYDWFTFCTFRCSLTVCCI
jgi:DNA-binding NtrC family response regulator